MIQTSFNNSTNNSAIKQGEKMSKIQIIRCPNCGKLAERFYCHQSRIKRTSCSTCDYLLVQCLNTGRVIEAYAPGINVCSFAS